MGPLCVMHSIVRSLVVAAAVAAAAACGSGAPQPGPAPAAAADTIYSGGDIVTMEGTEPSTEAVVVDDGRIIFVGAKVDALKRQGAGTVLKGRVGDDRLRRQHLQP